MSSSTTNAGIACRPEVFSTQYARFAQVLRRYGGPGGPLATIDSELRQARKGATVIIDSCAGVWLFGSPPLSADRVVALGVE